MEEIGLFMPLVGDIVMNGKYCAVVTSRRTLKSGKQSKVVTLMYKDGSFRTVNVRFCRPISALLHTSKIDQIRSLLAELESKEEKK